jgi:hypothetical protein
MKIEVSNSKLDGDAQAINEGLILSYIVGGSEVESDHVTHVNSEGRDEEQARALFCFHERRVEVHGPQLGLNLSGRQLGIGPLRQKICQHLGFDCFARRIREGLTHELDFLLGYPS